MTAITGPVAPATIGWVDHDGYRHAIYIGALPGRFEGADPQTHRVVAVFGNWSGVYVLATTGFLSDYYVAEKFPALADAPVGTLQAVTDGIAEMLGHRPTARTTQ